MAGFDPTDFNRWLRQRHAIRASRAGRSDFRWDDFYDDYGAPLEHDPGKYRIALRRIKVGIGVAAIVVVVLIVTRFGTGGPETPDIPTTTIAATTTTAAPTTTTTMTPLSEALHFNEQLVADPSRLIELGRSRRGGFLSVLTEAYDPLGDHLDSEKTRSPGYTGPEIDIVRMSGVTVALNQSVVQAAFNNTTFNCADTDPLVVCATSVLPMPEGEVMIVAVEHAAPIPTASTERSYIYAIVFDSDGDPANDWVFNPPFDWDLFQGTDRWYQAVYSHTTNTWTLAMTQVTADGSTEPGPSAARAVIVDGWVIWFVPSSELPLFPAPLRVTSFSHDGAFSPDTRGADVIGNNPTEPLLVFDPAG